MAKISSSNNDNMFMYVSSLVLSMKLRNASIMSITAVIYYFLAKVKLMCELSDDSKIICRNM